MLSDIKLKLLTLAPLPTAPLLPLPPPLYLEREGSVLLAPDKPSDYNFCTKMKTHSPQIYFQFVATAAPFLPQKQNISASAWGAGD